MGPKLETPTLFALEPEPERSAGLYVQVALNGPVRREFTYAVPARFCAAIERGCRVIVPLGSTRRIGYVVACFEHTDIPTRKLRSILDLLDREPIIDAELLGLTRWISDRYASSWGEALAAVLPSPLKRERETRKVAVASVCEGVGSAELEEVELRYPKQHRLLRTLMELAGPVALRDLLRQLKLSDSPARSLINRGWIQVERVESPPDVQLGGSSDRVRPDRLSPAQETAVAAITAKLAAAEHATFALEGVTGSGKTEVYLRTIERALELGRGAIVLVPEIALTPQTIGWFRSRFREVAVLHSGMTDAQRLAMWKRIKEGSASVVVGARSAVFAPLRDVGVIVVDEEHEPSFKQGSTPRYHAREVAIERARRAGAVCILGSATLSLETWRNARKGSFEHLLLPERVGGGAIPTVDIVDMRLERGRDGKAPLFSRVLTTFLHEVHEAGEQAILFLNRRGFVPVLWCPGCEETVRCKQCDMSLNYHRRIQRLVCHSCCDEQALVTACPSCGSPSLRFLGVGSERVEHELGKLLPDARVRRMDSDTMRRRQDYESVLELFGRGEVDVLVGTQMIAKGLDFPRVTLVGIVFADQALHLPDFRAAERTYQLIAQVAGRAGRGKLPGRIVVQTSTPEHPSIRLAARGDFASFARLEDAQRQELGYPPHGRLLRLIVEGTQEERVIEEAQCCVQELERELGGEGLVILGPTPAPISTVRGKHRHHLVVKSALPGVLVERAAHLVADFASGRAGPRITIDVDPMSMI